ncbi:MAG: uncharacterized protein QOE92_1012 [Chloroflexota bacterium]|nr:uncharacterized protein [Chloroflexota bacterium]
MSTREQNEKTFRDGYDAFGRGDMEAVKEFFHPDIVWHVGGHNIQSGDYKGHDDVIGFFLKSFELTDGTLKFEVHDVIANEEHSIALVTQHLERNGQSLDTNAVHVLHVNADGKATESWFLPEKAAELDALFQ